MERNFFRFGLGLSENVLRPMLVASAQYKEFSGADDDDDDERARK